MDPQTILILLTVTGAIAVAILGWCESGEPFDIKKFLPSMVRAALAGLVSAFAFQGIENPDTWLYLTAFLIGAGIDVFGNRLSGAYRQVRNE